MTRRMCFGLSFVSIILTLLTWTAPADAQPIVTIDAPADGLATNRDATLVVVSFESRSQGGGGNVSRVDLFAGGELVGQRENPSQDKEGTFEFPVDLTAFAEGEVEIRAVAFQGDPRAGLTGEDTVTLVVDRTPPAVDVTAPDDGIAVLDSAVTVTGTLSEPATVRIGNAEADVAELAFTAGVELREGTNTLAVGATDTAGNTGTDTVVVLHDTMAPRVVIASPRPGAVLSESSVTVTGTVQDTVIGGVDLSDCTVTVNGVAADVAQGSFVAFDVPVVEGAGTVTAVARDRGGNTATAVVPVTVDTRPRSRIVKVSGDGQSGMIASELGQPLVVRVEDNAGAPVAGRPVRFAVTRGDGTLASGERVETVVTDDAGQATARFTLGSHTGVASDQVSATAEGFFGALTFCATADPDPSGARKLAAVGGGNQQGAVSGLAPKPLIVLLTDENGNPRVGEAVTFEVRAGRGLVDGAATTSVTTDDDGRAFVPFTLGLDAGVNSQLVEAAAEGAEPVLFVATAFEAGDPADTAVSGVVLSGANEPIPGATVTLHGTELSAVTDDAGRFRLRGAPDGHVELVVDGRTAGAFPRLAFEVVLLAGVDLRMDRPVFLPVLDADGRAVANPDTDVVITRADTPGLELVVPAGSATFADGSTSGEVQVVRVNRDKIPMLPPDGTAPRLAFSIQPGDVVFDPPAPIRFPNLEGRAPGEVVKLFSFDHDVGEFVTVGTAQVTADGAFVASEPGQGIVKGGWHLTPPPPAEVLVPVVGECGLIRCPAAGFCLKCTSVDATLACSCSQDFTIAPVATPDAECFGCSFNPVPTCAATDSLPAGTACTRGRDDNNPELGGLPGTCRFPNGGTEPICCPDGHWDAANQACCEAATVDGTCPPPPQA